MSNIVYLFPGQGSQKVGMGQALCQRWPDARRRFEEADRVVGASLSQLCFEGPADELTDTINAQPALLAAGFAMYEAARQAGSPGPAWVAGHSLGHISALAAAGALQFGDALRLVRERGRAMKVAALQHPGGMAAILKLDAEKLGLICRQARDETGHYVGVANDNAPDQIVISGEMDALERALQLAKEAGAKRVIPLSVSVAAHTPLMASAAEAMRHALESVEVRQPSVPAISNVIALPIQDPMQIKVDLIKQLTNPVRWTASIETLSRLGATHFVEVGPGNVLAGLVKRILPNANAWSLDDPDGMDRLLALSQPHAS